MIGCGGDSSCSFDCIYDAEDCKHYCPCLPGCPSGCEDCPSPFCTCQDFQSNPDYIACKNKFEDIYARCLNQCTSNDFECIATCTRDFDRNLLDCPCRQNCPNGCPCDNYKCAPDSVLILNTYLPGNVPVITDASGRVDTNTGFTFGENTSVFEVCSVTFQNEFYIYGGKGSFARQISKIVGCRLDRVGTLPFDHQYATCATSGDDRIYLCFDYRGSVDEKKCRFATHPEGPFSNVPDSYFGHTGARIAASPSKF